MASVPCLPLGGPSSSSAAGSRKVGQRSERAGTVEGPTAPSAAPALELRQTPSTDVTGASDTLAPTGRSGPDRKMRRAGSVPEVISQRFQCAE